VSRTREIGYSLQAEPPASFHASLGYGPRLGIFILVRGFVPSLTKCLPIFGAFSRPQRATRFPVDPETWSPSRKLHRCIGRFYCPGAPCSPVSLTLFLVTTDVHPVDDLPSRPHAQGDLAGTGQPSPFLRTFSLRSVVV